MRPLLFLDVVVEGNQQSCTIIQSAVCEMCKELLRVYLCLCQLDVFNCFAPSPFMSVIHSTETVNWLLSAVTLFHLESIFFCCTCCKRFPTLGPAFSHHLIPLGLFTSPYLTLLLITVRGATHTLPRHPSPLDVPLPSYSVPSEPPLEQGHEADGRRGRCCNKPLDLYGPPFSPCINL